jgi:hypothetical protein
MGWIEAVEMDGRRWSDDGVGRLGEYILYKGGAIEDLLFQSSRRKDRFHDFTSTSTILLSCANRSPAQYHTLCFQHGDTNTYTLSTKHIQHLESLSDLAATSFLHTQSRTQHPQSALSAQQPHPSSPLHLTSARSHLTQPTEGFTTQKRNNGLWLKQRSNRLPTAHAPAPETQDEA